MTIYLSAPRDWAAQARSEWSILQRGWDDVYLGSAVRTLISSS